MNLNPRLHHDCYKPRPIGPIGRVSIDWKQHWYVVFRYGVFSLSFSGLRYHWNNHGIVFPFTIDWVYKWII